MDASGSEISVDSFSDIMSESEYDEDEVPGKSKARAGELSEPTVVDWLYSAGFPQYVDMYQSKREIFSFYFFFLLLRHFISISFFVCFQSARSSTRERWSTTTRFCRPFRSSPC